MAARRRPAEAIARRTAQSKDCEDRVRQALSRLVKAGVPFTVADVCTLAGIERTFIYSQKRPDLTQAVLDARNQSVRAATTKAEDSLDAQTASWRERALNAEAVVSSLRSGIQRRDEQVSDLTGMLYDADGVHLVEENTRLRELIRNLTRSLAESEKERTRLARSLDGARANVKRERGRNVTQLFGDNP